MKSIKKVCDLVKKFNVILENGHKHLLFLILVLSLIGAVVETVGVSAILPLVQIMIEPEQMMKNSIANRIFLLLGCNNSNEAMLIIAFFVITIYLIKNIYLCILSWARVKCTTKIQKDLSIKMLKSYMSRGYSFFRQTNSSALLRGTTDSITGVYTVTLMAMKILAEIMTIACIIVYVVLTDWIMAFSVVALVGLCLFVITNIFRKLMKHAGMIYHQGVNDVNKWSLQMFSGIKEILIYNRKDYFINNYEKSMIGLQKGRVRQTVATEIPAYIIEGACITGIIIAICLRIGTMENPAIFIPQLASFAVAVFRLLPSVGRISSNMNMCIFCIPAVTEVYNNILEARLIEKEMESALPVSNKGLNQSIAFSNQIQVKDIVWCYPDGEKNVLDGISFTVKKGESVALVGASGGGKSTMADVILGLLKPQNGVVLIDGNDLSEDRTALASLISFVPQSVYLLDDSIRKNVAFGIEDEHISDDDIWNALDQAKMKEYVESLPNGIDTLVGERGVRFSGGQAQRLAIARALYTNPEILVLDEATSALDSETENAVMKAIEALQGKKTLFIIAHRLSTIKNCDKIYEIVDGKAVKRKYEDLY